MSSVDGHVARLGRAQEAEAVGQDLEDAVAEDLLAVLGALLHDREHQLLLAHAGDVLDLQRFAHLDELGDVEGFQFGEVHGVGDAGREAWERRTGADGPVGTRSRSYRDRDERGRSGSEADTALRDSGELTRDDRVRSVPARAGLLSRQAAHRGPPVYSPDYR
jgi:hypothetical protein